VATTRLTEDVLPPDLQDRLKAEFVAPLVLYLCSDECGETGMVLNAGMGCFNRAALLTGPGAVVGDGSSPPSPEDIHRHWAAINSLENASEHASATAALGDMVNAFSPQSEPGAQAEKGTQLTVKSVFERMPEMFQADKAAGVEVVFQYRISGPGGGEWHVVIANQTCEVVEGVHPNPTTTILMTEENFLALIKGELNAMQAFTSGKLKIEGDLMKSQLIEKLFRFGR
jgi:putative sterol carrier protein